jgi:hypothetical protein
MISFTKVFSALLLLLSIAIGGTAFAQDVSAAETERFGGDAQIGSQPPFPIHLELRRSADAVTGTVSVPSGNFELVDAQGADTIIGRFRGDGGSGALTLRVDGDVLAGVFNLEGQPGVITARRTSQAAEAFFRPPEQQFDLTTAQWLVDLDRMVEVLTREHASPFHRVSREQFERDVARVRGAIPKLDGVAVALEFRKLGAMIGDGHTSVELPHRRPRLPIEFYWFEDGLRVVGVSATHQNLLGASVPDLVNNPDVLRAIGIDARLSFAFTFETVEGTQKQVKIAAETEVGERVTLGNSTPLWQRNETQGFWNEWLADGSVYVNWRSYDGLADQGAALLQSLDAKHPRRLIIDLRDNDGGDYTVGRTFIEGIRSRPWLSQRGVLYVMIGRRTFSAAMTNAVDFKHKTEAILVGEPAGAAPNNWQEVRRFQLPNSGLRVGVSTRYYEFLPGKSEVLPDLLASPELSDWGSPQDEGVRLILDQRSWDAKSLEIFQTRPLVPWQ